MKSPIARSKASLGRGASSVGAGLRAAVPLLLGILLALAAVEYALPSVGRVGPFRVEMGARLSPQGETTLAFPPFGEVSAATHRGVPLELRFTLMGVDVTALRAWVGETSSAEAALTSAEGSLRPMARAYLGRTLVLAMLLGAAGAYVAGSGKRGAAAGALTAGLTVAFLAGGVAVDFDRTAFSRPRYQGALEAAPWVVGLLEKSWGKVGSLGEQMETLAQNLSGLSEQLSGLSAVGRPPRDLRLLHVSDLHNNPVGVKFIAEAVQAFGVDAVVDTGDLTDWGTPLEADLVRGITRLGVPYFFVPGNHDSPALLRELRRHPRITILDGRAVAFRGLVLLGAADPASDRNDPEVAAPEVFAEAARALLVKVEVQPKTPDVVAVHNGLLGEPLLGKVRVLLRGHDHRLSVKEEAGTTVIDAGTTGAAGVRGLEGRREVPYSMALLYFSRTPEGYRLRTVDTLEVRSQNAGFTLNRILVGDEGNPGGAGEPSSNGPGARPATTGR